MADLVHGKYIKLA